MLTLQSVAELHKVLASINLFQEWVWSVLNFIFLLLNTRINFIFIFFQSLLFTMQASDPFESALFKFIFIEILVVLFSGLVLCLVNSWKVFVSFTDGNRVFFSCIPNFLLLISSCLRFLLPRLNLILFFVNITFQEVQFPIYHFSFISKNTWKPSTNICYFRCLPESKKNNTNHTMPSPKPFQKTMQKKLSIFFKISCF